MFCKLLTHPLIPPTGLLIPSSAVYQWANPSEHLRWSASARLRDTAMDGKWVSGAQDAEHLVRDANTSSGITQWQQL